MLALLTCVAQLKDNPLLSWVEYDLTIITAGIVLLAIAIDRIRNGPTTGRMILPWILWAAFLPAVASSTLDGYALVKVGTLFSITFVLAIAPFWLLRTEQQRLSFLVSLGAISAGVAALALVFDRQAAASYTNRLVLDGADTIGTARLGMTGAVAFFILAFYPNLKVLTRVIVIGLGAVTGMLAVLAGSRGPVIAGAVAIVAVIIFSPSMKKYRGRALLAVIAAGGVIVWFATRAGSDGLSRIVSIFLGEGDTSTAARQDAWQAGLTQVAKDPMGIGWGKFAELGLRHNYPHNLFIEVAVEAGVIVAAAFIIFVLVTFVRGIRVSRDVVSMAIFGLFIFSLVNAMVSADINGTRLLWVTLFAIWVIPKSETEKWFYSGSNTARFKAPTVAAPAARALARR